MKAENFTVEAMKQIILGEGVLNDIATMNLALAKNYCPVKTGALNKSINYVIDEDEMAIIVGSDVPYAENVEYGTAQMERAHGKHDPKNPVLNWKAKEKTGRNQGASLPFLRPAVFETQHNMEYFIPKKVKMNVKLMVR